MRVTSRGTRRRAGALNVAIIPVYQRQPNQSFISSRPASPRIAQEAPFPVVAGSVAFEVGWLILLLAFQPPDIAASRPDQRQQSLHSTRTPLASI
jgi:hypothetical protein